MNKPAPEPKATRSSTEDFLLGPYRVGARLGIGGAASVHLGLRVHAVPDEATAHERLVSLKVIHEHLTDEREFVIMFFDEARVAVQLDHPNIVRTYEMGQEDEQLFLAMEYLHGHSLHEMFLRGTKQGARLPVDLVAWIGAQVSRALHYAHRLIDTSGQPLHVVHRDVSPRNIFITYDGEVKLIDFGIAQTVGKMAKTKAGQMKGTFSYIAPERALGGTCDHRADIFSLAASLYEAATGHRLFRGADEVQTLRNVLTGNVPDPSTLREGFPQRMTQILLKALETDPDSRHQTALELATDLDAFVSACGLEPPKARLSLMMNTIFAEERMAKEAAIAQLKGGLATPDEAEAEPPEEPCSLAVSVARRLSLPPPRSWHAWTVGLFVTLIVAASVFIAVRPFSRVTPPAAAQTATAPSTVTIDVSVVPAVEATFKLGTSSATGSMARFDPPIGSSPMAILVQADGFQDAEMDIVPDRNHTVAIPLKKQFAATAASSTPNENRATTSVASNSADAVRQPGTPSTSSTGSRSTLIDLLNKRH